MPTRTVKLDQVRRSLPLAKQLTKKLDIDRDGAVADDEVKRIQVRDNFVARNLISSAMDRLSYPDNAGPYDIASVQAELDGGLKSLQRADKDADGVLTDEELKKASKVGKALVEFSKTYEGQSVAVFDIKPFERPGTKAWLSLVKKDYFGRPNEPMNRPYFGTALVLKKAELPNAKLKAAYDALVAEYPGATVQATQSEVNGAKVFYMHAMSDGRYDVRLFDAKGTLLSSGIAKPNARDARAKWQVRWVDA